MCVSARACVWQCHACTASAANPSVPWSVQADYLEHVAKDIESANQRYARACTLAPDNADILGAFAAFLAHTRKDLELAEEYYCRAIELDRRHPENLGGYAVLLMTLYRRGGDVAVEGLRAGARDAGGGRLHRAPEARARRRLHRAHARHALVAPQLVAPAVARRHNWRFGTTLAAGPRR